MKTHPKDHTESLQNYLKLCLKAYEQSDKEIEKKIATLPAETLTVSKRKKRFEYRICENHRRTYIAKVDNEQIKTLCEKEYLLRLHRYFRKVLPAMRHLYDCLTKQTPFGVYSSLHPGKQPFIEKVFQTDDDYAERWLAIPYEHKPALDATFTTDRGEKVRSKSELIIANKLYVAGIPYRYEPRFELPIYKTAYPDFVVLNKRTREEFVWEHFGMMEDPEYRTTTLRKLLGYSKQGIFPGHFIATFEAEKDPLTPATVDKIIREQLL